MLGIAFVGHGWARMPMPHRVLLGIGGVFMAQPSRTGELIGVALAALPMLQQVLAVYRPQQRLRT
jgi:hypothetical protein